MHKKYACYIGRWQTWHPGHEWLINQKLQEGVPVLIMVRDVELDDNNCKTALQICVELTQIYKAEIDQGMVHVIPIPDIESINYGRKVGYDIIEHIPPDDIEVISGTKIRSEQKVKKAEDGLWGDDYNI
jgi:hypothetical protein